MRKADRVVERLLERRQRVLSGLPPFEELMRGSVFERSIRCGKPTCRCASGTGHPATYLSATFAGGRTQQITVPRPLVPAVRRWVANYLRWWRAIERVSAINRQLLRLRALPQLGPAAASPTRTRARRGGR
jgi:hypothetical protein